MWQVIMARCNIAAVSSSDRGTPNHDTVVYLDLIACNGMILFRISHRSSWRRVADKSIATWSNVDRASFSGPVSGKTTGLIQQPKSSQYDREIDIPVPQGKTLPVQRAGEDLIGIGAWAKEV